MVNLTDQSMAETTEIASIRPASGRHTDRSGFRVEFAAISHPGKVRANNEDHYLVTRISRSFSVVSTNVPKGTIPVEVEEVGYVMVVADGMGGMAAGEKASQIAIRTGVQLVLKSPVWTTRITDDEERQLIQRMREYFREVDSEVIKESRTDRHLTGMGTTLTLAYIVGADAFIVHVGDSRAYLFRDGKLGQLTRDHTMAQGLADAGAIRADEVQHHAKRHVLTNFVGGPSKGVEPDVSRLKLQDGDFILLCSDGLTEMVDDEQIARTIAEAKTPDKAAPTLIDRALENGGRDNVTVVLAQCHLPRSG